MRVEYVQTGLAVFDGSDIIICDDHLSDALPKVVEKLKEFGSSAFPAKVSIVIEDLTTPGSLAVEKDGKWTF